MKVIAKTIENQTDPVSILPFADTHIGDAHCDMELVLSSIQHVLETPNMYTILDGDIFNVALAGSPSDVYRETMSPSDQLIKCAEIFQPLADAGKILACLPGNHEARQERF